MNLIWAAGVKGALINGFLSDSIDSFHLIVDKTNRVKNYEDIFAVGDIVLIKGFHAMVAQIAIQQGLGALNSLVSGHKMKGFR